MKPITVVSLFNGMSVAQMAFEEVYGRSVDVWYSEVDKHANKVTETLYPLAHPLGDVRNITASQLPPNIDFLVGGSPCQSFSFSGKRNGMTTKSNEEILSLSRYLELKDGGFEFVGQSYLFWEYIRLLNDIKLKNPNVKFLLENVVMSKKWENVITGVLDVKPIKMDSALVSGQQRKRLYWTNINDGDIPQPEDSNINFREVLTCNKFPNKATILGRRLNEFGKRDDYNKQIPITQCIEVRATNLHKTNCITTVAKDNVLTVLPIGRHTGAFTTYKKDVDWRYLNARETLRLQTIPEDKIDKILNVVSENQAYKMAGNGWTLRVITHIIKQHNGF